MISNCFYKQENTNNIIILCPSCGQQIRLPIIISKLEVSCNTCHEKFFYKYGDGFDKGKIYNFVIPYVLIVLYISIAWIIIGGILSVILANIPSGSVESRYLFLCITTLCLAFVLLISSGSEILLNVEGIPNILRMKQVILSNIGIGFYNKNGIPIYLLCWKIIINVKIRVKKYFIIGNDPSIIEIYLNDGSKIKLPIGIFLTIDDRFSIIHDIQNYLSISYFGEKNE